MAKSIKEISRKAEELIEKGNEVDRNVQSCQARVASMSSAVAAARSQLNTAMETDEYGNPKGDVSLAAAQLGMAENMLAASQRALSSAESDAERIRQQKSIHIKGIEQHNRIEKTNLEKLKKLRSEAFGENSVALSEGIAQRINEAEDARAALLRSMGLDENPEYVSAGNEGSSVLGRKSGIVAQIESSGETDNNFGGDKSTDLPGKGIKTPFGGGLKKLISSVFGSIREKDAAITSEAYDEPAGKRRYTSHEELSEELDIYACDYQAHHNEYNSVLRSNQTNDRIERFRSLINNHQLPEDTILFRRATMADLGSKLANLSTDELVGKCYQFDGIMSTGPKSMANTVCGSETVLFEIKAPAGMPGLDLTQVSYFQEAMFDSPYCYIESVKKEGNNTTCFVIRIVSAGDGINRANDYESLKQYMDAKYKLQLDESIKNLDFDTVKGAIAGVESVISEYPSVGEYLLSGITSTEGIMSCNGSILSFNPRYFADNEILPSTCREMANRGFWVSNASTISIGVHEAAHGVEMALINANPQYITNEQTISAWNNCIEARKIVGEACGNIQNTEYGRNKTRTELIRSISVYGATSYSEAMAEAFADVYANGEKANPLSVEIKRLTYSLMEQYKGERKNANNL